MRFESSIYANMTDSLLEDYTVKKKRLTEDVDASEKKLPSCFTCDEPGGEKFSQDLQEYFKKLETFMDNASQYSVCWYYEDNKWYATFENYISCYDSSEYKYYSYDEILEAEWWDEAAGLGLTPATPHIPDTDISGQRITAGDHCILVPEKFYSELADWFINENSIMDDVYRHIIVEGWEDEDWTEDDWGVDSDWLDDDEISVNDPNYDIGVSLGIPGTWGVEFIGGGDDVVLFNTEEEARNYFNSLSKDDVGEDVDEIELFVVDDDGISNVMDVVICESLKEDMTDQEFAEALGDALRKKSN